MTRTDSGRIGRSSPLGTESALNGRCIGTEQWARPIRSVPRNARRTRTRGDAPSGRAAECGRVTAAWMAGAGAPRNTGPKRRWARSVPRNAGTPTGRVPSSVVSTLPRMRGVSLLRIAVATTACCSIAAAWNRRLRLRRRGGRERSRHAQSQAGAAVVTAREGGRLDRDPALARRRGRVGGGLLAAAQGAGERNDRHDQVRPPYRRASTRRLPRAGNDPGLRSCRVLGGGPRRALVAMQRSRTGEGR